MPFLSAIVGYVTNVVAIKMMFHPITFWGVWEPWLGWQGIVPRKAAKMASISVDTITEKLITEEEIFSRMDPQRVAEELRAPMLSMVEEITDSVMLQHQPTIWRNLPEPVRRTIVRRIQKDAPEVVEEIMQDVRQNIREMFDLKDMVVANLVRNKPLINRIFLETGHAEFKFIARSGLYFGFLFGCVQMGVWVLYKGWWLLPAFGLLVGWATNWLALKMIFNPKELVRVGPLRVQGLFHKRQYEVARDYGNLVADEIVTPGNILEAILKGPYSDRIVTLIDGHVQRAIDEQTGYAKPFVTMTVGNARYNDIKQTAVAQVVAHMPETFRHVTSYAEEAMQIKSTLVTRLQGLNSIEFEGMLRPAFEEDEWILITVGAALGFAVGWFQLVVLFGDEFAAAFGG
ncbi:MAG: DUF445 domain-containing protein [Salinisphaeraceae bacterium]|nr:DUF445 domain-containing protein [Salinisphaeraceae bacterium]